MVSKELKEYLLDNGATQVGFAYLPDTYYKNMSSGIFISLKIPYNIIKSISDGPNIEYYNEYISLNNKLNYLAVLGAKFIEERGYKAIAQTTDNVKVSADYRTRIPHKTVGILAGLGWIGKNSLFVTKEYGSAIRLTSIITNLKLDYGIPIMQSLCNKCKKCTEACPAVAIHGTLWSESIDRNELFDPIKCSKKARELTKERFNKEVTICGKCIEICPYTQRYIRNEHKRQIGSESNLGI